MEWWAMSTEMQLASGSTAERYEALLRIAEALSACSDTEEMARALADQLNAIIHFEHLDILAFKENSEEVEWHAWGKGTLPMPNGRIEELPIWHLYYSQELLHIADWDSDERFPHLKQWAATIGARIGSVVRVPLTTPRRRLGTLGIASGPGSTYSAEDVGFLRQVARVAAFAIDDSLNLRRVEAAQAELQRQNERLQLLLNLTDNAIKYNEPHGRVEISLRRSAASADLSISNTGPGIAPEFLERIFDRFFRGDPSQTANVEGCGLGLAIVEWIVQAHAGTIEITSEPGASTTVHVAFPIKARDQTARTTRLLKPLPRNKIRLSPVVPARAR
jgi:signal transduction histidine kinase